MWAIMPMFLMSDISSDLCTCFGKLWWSPSDLSGDFVWIQRRHDAFSFFLTWLHGNSLWFEVTQIKRHIAIVDGRELSKSKHTWRHSHDLHAFSSLLWRVWRKWSCRRRGTTLTRLFHNVSLRQPVPNIFYLMPVVLCVYLGDYDTRSRRYLISELNRSHLHTFKIHRQSLMYT